MIDQSNKQMKELVSEYVIEEKENITNLNTILIRVKNNRENFTAVIHSLEPFLINNNDIFRKNSVKLISLILERVSNLKLTEKELKKMLEFSFGKIKDVVCTPSAVKTIFCSNFLIF